RSGLRPSGDGAWHARRAAAADGAAGDRARRRARRARAVRIGGTMYSLAVSDHVMIAHSFVGEIFGPAQRLHGATYAVEMEVRRAELDGDGLVCDIGKALETLKTVLAEINYRNLDDVPAFKGRNTTTEFLAGEIFRRLKP